MLTRLGFSALLVITTALLSMEKVEKNIDIKKIVYENHFSSHETTAHLKYKKNCYEKRELSNIKQRDEKIFKNTFNQKRLHTIVGGMYAEYTKKSNPCSRISSALTSLGSFTVNTFNSLWNSKKYEDDSCQKVFYEKKDSAPNFDWNNPYIFGLLPCKLISAKDKNYLYCNTPYDVKVYEFPNKESLFQGNFGPSGWSEDHTCFYSVEQNKQKKINVILYDFKYNKIFEVPSQTNSPLHHIFSCSSYEDIRFITQIDNFLQITNIRTQETQCIKKGGGKIQTLRIYGTYLWVHYHTEKNEELVIYDLMKDYKEIKTITGQKSIAPILCPYGSPKQYAIWCVDGNVTVFESANGKKIPISAYQTEPLVPLVCTWNHENTMFTLSPMKEGSTPTVHVLYNEKISAIPLEHDTKTSLIADLGFQGSIVAVSCLDDQGRTKRIQLHDTATGKKVGYATSNTYLQDYGFCAPNCVFVCSATQFFIYNFQENEVLFTLYHDNKIKKISNSKRYYLIGIDCDELSLIDIFDTTKKSILRNEKEITNAWFDNERENYVAIAYDTTLEIITLETPESKAIIPIDSPVDHIIFDPTGTLCAVITHNKKIMSIYNLENSKNSLFTTSYTSEIVLADMKFSASQDNLLLAVPTHSKTYVYKTNKKQEKGS